MRYCVLGRLSSQDEEAAIASAISGRRYPRSLVRRVAEFVAQLRALDTEGFEAVKDAWIETGIPGLVVFTGRHAGEEPTTQGGRRLFAALELDGQGRPDVLIKLTDDYGGTPQEWNDNLADAVDRHRRGTRIP